MIPVAGEIAANHSAPATGCVCGHWFEDPPPRCSFGLVWLATIEEEEDALIEPSNDEPL